MFKFELGDRVRHLKGDRAGFVSSRTDSLVDNKVSVSYCVAWDDTKFYGSRFLEFEIEGVEDVQV